MIFKILTVVSLLEICAGDIPSNPQPQSNQAVYSQSFVRHDVPLSYKYSAVHVYSTQKPDQYNHKPHFLHQNLDKTPQKQIQYAPIYNAPSNQNEFESKFTHNPHIIPEYTEEVTTEQAPLEPKPLEQINSVQRPQHLSYVPGYNIELLKSVNRYPGHNAVYRSYPHMSSNAKTNKVNFLNQYVPREKLAGEYITTTKTTKTANPSTITYQPEHSIATFSPFVLNQYNPGFKPMLYNGPHIAQGEHAPAQTLINLEELVPHPKTHKMLLNIARTYNFAQNPQKAQHPSLTLLKNIPAHAQTIVQMQNPGSVDKNTRLFPIPNKQMRPSAHRWP